MPNTLHHAQRRICGFVVVAACLWLCARAGPAAPRTDPAALVVLGASLFSDARLSSTGRVSCASCHRPLLAYTDGVPLAIGTTGERGTRNTPTLLHSASLPAYTWDDPRVTNIQTPIRRALTRVLPVEMGARGREEAILNLLRNDPTRARQFLAAFGTDGDAVTWDHLVGALAAFVQTLGKPSPYDRFLAGDVGALTAQQQQGMQLFAEAGCVACHSGPLFTNGSYHNLGLYRDDAQPERAGLAASTGDAVDRGRFRVPSLRNVARTAPYFHDGSAATLDDVLSVYEKGGRLITRGANAGDGRANPNKSGALAPIQLTKADRAALIAFLEALSDAP